MSAPAPPWQPLFERHGLCFAAVVERHGKTAGNVAHGLLKDFGLKHGAVASSVGHDSHNIIIAGTNEEDMQVARSLAALAKRRAGRDLGLARRGQAVSPATSS